MQENNFKAVLESIRDLMNEDTVMPDWLHDIFLGYGDPAQAKYTHMPADQLLQTIDFKVQQQACVWPKVFAACCLLFGQLSLDAFSIDLSSLHDTQVKSCHRF